MPLKCIKIASDPNILSVLKKSIKKRNVDLGDKNLRKFVSDLNVLFFVCLEGVGIFDNKKSCNENR
jgi:hypothetical protein